MLVHYASSQTFSAVSIILIAHYQQLPISVKPIYFNFGCSKDILFIIINKAATNWLIMEHFSLVIIFLLLSPFLTKIVLAKKFCLILPMQEFLLKYLRKVLKFELFNSKCSMVF